MISKLFSENGNQPELNKIGLESMYWLIQRMKWASVTGTKISYNPVLEIDNCWAKENKNCSGLISVNH